MDKGLLPNLYNIKKKGGFSCLKSTEPPNSFPPWTSFMTGVNPGEHSVFYPLLYPDTKSYKAKVVSSQSPKVKNIWQKLSEKGTSVGVINQPMTYPPFEVNGFLITGRITPSMKKDFTFPRALKNEILKYFPKYKINLSYDTDYSEKENIESLINNLIIRKELSFYLFNRYNPEVKVVIHTEPDTICHRLWEKKKYINYLYIKLDKVVGEYLDGFSDHNVIIVSDHGFGSCYSNVYLNNYLKKTGLLEIKKNRIKISKKSNLKIWLKKVLANFKLLKLIKKIKIAKIKKNKSFQGVENYIDFSKTKIYCRNDLGLRINLKGREIQGDVSNEEIDSLYKELQNNLLKIKDSSYFDMLIFKDILRKEDVYSGPYTQHAPDFILKYNPLYNRCVKAKITNGDIIQKNEEQTGKHTPYGIYFATRDFKNEFPSFEINSITDVAPLTKKIIGF